MKNLLYKELRLSMHPVCYIFVFLFPFMVFIPNYPLFVSFIYVCTCYPLLFMGANKGVQTNDLLFSVLLPVRKKDIVLARIIVCSLMQFASMSLVAILSPFAKRVLAHVDITRMQAQGFNVAPTLGMLGFDELSIVLSFILIAFCFYDFLFFIIYYKDGRAILSSTFISMFVFILIVTLTIIVLPASSRGYLEFFVNMKAMFRALFFASSLCLYILSHYFTLRTAAKLLQKVDF